MRTSMILLLGLVWTLAAGEVPAPTRTALRERVELRSLIRFGLRRNPDIAAARAEWEAAIAAVPQAESLPDPMVSFDYFGESVETRVGPQEYRYGLSQGLPWPGTLDQAGEVAAHEVRVRHIAYDRAIRDFIVEAKISFHELLYLRRAMAITRQNQELLQHILKVTSTAHAKGKAKLHDLLRAQSQLAQLGYDLVLLRELEQVETAKLNSLLDRPTAAPLGEAEMPEVRLVQPAIGTLEKLALQRRQEVAQARAKEAQASAGIELTKRKNRPSFQVRAMRIETGEAVRDIPESGKDPWMVGVGVSIPLWRGRNAARVQEARKRHEAAGERVRSAENRTRAEVKRVYFRLENARRLIQLYEGSLIPQAKRAMEAAEQWHDGEVAEVSGFLETQSVWLNFNLARLRAVTDYQQYRARLERLLGGPIPESPEAE